MKTVLITGSSSGIGKAAVQFFQSKGWQVAATMRRPERETDLNQLDNVKLYELDVTNNELVKAAIDQAIQDFGGIDVVINNAGYGLAGPFETASEAQIERQFDTNLFGVMRVTREVLPHFRARKAGMFINITSIGGLITLPYFSLYHGTKWALEGFTESLRFELDPFNIKVRLVEPGGVNTDFASRSLAMTTTDTDIEAYNEHLEKIFAAYTDENRALQRSAPAQIAEVIYEAATSESDQMKYVAGEDAKQLWQARQSMTLEDFHGMIKTNFGLNENVEA
ncbi:SDR family oxidoreductase [Microscilla marina]|uniref:Oxidoreductase, short chain dehydrogenase/reductase family n=1 Tax=Microscilla marina ATCC 23134 TaxID=313606 RepID=A1ZL47_MICM2|nr:SDR family oxidoreductase [Microscilla marina]EAY29013.1 oxidoreductase, short chain dehydrogenase/reductase family [Microscilla marina ATCC 23134]